MNKTGIEYVDYTWNPVTGCQHNCEYCYARRLAEDRFPDMYTNGFEYTFWENRLDEPNDAEPSSILVSSMGDLFGDWVPKKDIKKVLKVAARLNKHDFLFLTKNPSRYDRMFCKGDELPPNFWMGTSIENQDKVERLSKLPWYMKTFLSLEPLLGPVELSRYNATDLDWIIFGAKTGPDPKQPKREWVDDILDFGLQHNIPVFIKDNLDFPVPVQNFPEVYQKPRELIEQIEGEHF